MMLTADAFSGAAGELDRLRSGSLPPPVSEKAGKNAKAAANGDSFPGMLESIQSAMDKAGGISPEGEAALVESLEEEGLELLGAALKKGFLLEKNLMRAAGEEKIPADGAALYEELEEGGSPALPFALPLQKGGERPTLSEPDAGGKAESLGLSAPDAGGNAEALGLSAPDAGGKAEALVLSAPDAGGNAEALGLSAPDAGGKAESLVLSAPDVIEEGAAGEGAGAAAAIAAQDAREPLNAEAAADEGAPLFAEAAAKTRESPAASERRASFLEAGQASGDQPKEAADGARERPLFEVTDLRSNARPAERQRTDFRGAAPAAGAALEQDSAQPYLGSDIEMHLNLSGDSPLESPSALVKEGFSAAAEGSLFSQNSRTAGEGPAAPPQGAGAYSSLAERLGSELRSNAADIVRAGQLVLRDGGEGTIRLALQPEALGDVRIRLEMSGDKRIAGRITVSTREAWDAFSESMESLVAAFSEEGFDTAGFDLSWSGREGAGAASAPFYASAIPNIMPEGNLSDDYSIVARRQGSPYAVDIFA